MAFSQISLLHGHFPGDANGHLQRKSYEQRKSSGIKGNTGFNRHDLNRFLQRRAASQSLQYANMYVNSPEEG